MAYIQKVSDLFTAATTGIDPNIGNLDESDSSVGTGISGAPSCGDVMKIQIKVDDSGNISDVKYKIFGCGSAIAASAYLTQMLKGMTLKQATEIKNSEIAEALSLPPVKIHCSILAEEAIKNAISNYEVKQKNPQIN